MITPVYRAAQNKELVNEIARPIRNTKDRLSEEIQRFGMFSTLIKNEGFYTLYSKGFQTARYFRSFREIKNYIAVCAEVQMLSRETGKTWGVSWDGDRWYAEII